MNIGKYFKTDHISEAPLRFVNRLIMSMYPAKYMAEVTVNTVCVVDGYVVEKKMDIILIKMKPYNYPIAILISELKSTVSTVLAVLYRHKIFITDCLKVDKSDWTWCSIWYIVFGVSHDVETLSKNWYFDKHPTMHYLGIPSHTQLTVAHTYNLLTEYTWEFLSKNEMLALLLAPLDTHTCMWRFWTG